MYIDKENVQFSKWMKHFKNNFMKGNCILIYKALSFDVAQGRMNGAPNETRTHSCWFASLAC